MCPLGHGFPSCAYPTATRVKLVTAAAVRRMTIIHRLPYAITRVDGGSHAATWDLKQRSVH
jgi:hypothetical protein